MADAEDLKAAAFPHEPVSSRNHEAKSREVEPQTHPDGHSLGNHDAVEVALAAALTGATAAGEWSTVARIAAELEARRLARSAVVDLNAERKRRQS
ncbi:MAG: hypothetical protein ACM3ZE_06695 [Myxococcales bacterium]